MPIPHDLTADLPPPRDDEPVSLRRDIVDELTDHLACALHRELLLGGTSGPCETASDSPDSSFRTDPHPDSSFRTAHEHVLTRFGNPAAVARRLWLDAMKEKLMAQKITILLASVATVAVVVLSGLMWQSLQRSQEAQAALLQQHQQFSAGILQALESLRPGPPASTGVEGWTPLTVKLVSKTGEPVQGDLYLSGTRFGGGKSDIIIQRTTGPEGIIDFGMLPYGNYELHVLATAAGESHNEDVMLAPGHSTERSILCPTSPLPEVEMRFAFNPPEGLRADELRYEMQITALPRNVDAGQWRRAGRDTFDLWVDANGRILELVSDARPAAVENREPHRRIMALRFEELPVLRNYAYRLNGVRVYAPFSGIEEDSSVPRADLFAVTNTRSDLQLSDVTFRPEPGVENVWRIDLPDYVWSAAVETFRSMPEVRQVAIPEGFETVKLDASEMRWDPERFRLGQDDHVDLAVRVVTSPDDPEGEEIGILLSSAEVVAIDRDTAPGSRRNAKMELVLMVSPEQKAAIEQVQQFKFAHFSISRTEEILPEPMLHADVLESLKNLTESNDP